MSDKEEAKKLISPRADRDDTKELLVELQLIALKGINEWKALKQGGKP